MKIKMFQQGGGGIPAFNYYTPITPQGASTEVTTGDKSGKDKDDIGIKDILDLIKGLEGLPSDIQQLTNEFSRFFQFSNSGVSPSMLASRYLTAVGKIATAKFNKGYYDQVYEDQEANGGLNEVAITNNGQLIVQNKNGELTTVNVNDYLENKSEYSPVTNSNLLYLRAHNKAFDNGFLTAAENGIGLQSVHDMLDKFVQNLGTNEARIGGYSSTKKQQILEAFQTLEQLSAQGVDISGITTIDGLYKSDIVTKSQAEQIQQALAYSYQMLPDNAKTLLQYKSNGKPLDLIMNLILQQSSSYIQFDPTLKANLDGSGLDGNNAEDKIKQNTVQQWIRGFGNQVQYQMNNGTMDGISIWGNELPVVTSEGKPLPNGTLQELAESQYSGVLDLNHISIGDCAIKKLDLNKVIFDGQAQRMDLPINPLDPNKPDLDMLNRLSEAQTEIRENNITNYQEINKIYQDHQLPFMYNPDGTLNVQHWKTFLVVNGTATDTAIQGDASTSVFLKEIKDRDYERSAVQFLKTKDKNFDYDSSAFLGIQGTKNHMYEGNIFIPININYFNAGAGSGQQFTTQQGTYLEGLQQQKNKELGFISRSLTE